jgi:hypothetical protein
MALDQDRRILVFARNVRADWLDQSVWAQS